MRYLLTILTFLISIQGSMAQKEIYEKAYQKINCMLDGTCELSFKNAVFEVENAYYNNKLDYESYDKTIKVLGDICRKLISSRELLYDFKDKKEVKKCASVFTLMTDSIPILFGTNDTFYHPPYSYDFKDIWGYGEWSNMFVFKLLETKKGNCHSLPFLYKIIAEEIGLNAHLAIAPNHFYIKHQNEANGWYNTELTSGMFPIDAWLMASGYIHLDAIVNKLYMEALDDKQSIAICLIDLAKGYERKFGVENGEFVLKCCQTALEYYPHYINGLLLKAETKKKLFDTYWKQYGVDDPNMAFMHPEARKLFEEMEQLYAEIHELGYRKMPEKMYLEWLFSLEEERERYENKNIIKFTK